MCLSCVTTLQQDRTSKDLLCGTASRGTLASAVVSVAQHKLSRCASLQRRSCATALTALRLAPKAVVHQTSASTTEYLPLSWD